MTGKIVREFHHTLLWPVQLRPLKRDASAGVVHYWETLKRHPGPWTYVDDPLLINDDTCVIGTQFPPDAAFQTLGIPFTTNASGLCHPGTWCARRTSLHPTGKQTDSSHVVPYS